MKRKDARTYRLRVDQWRASKQGLLERALGHLHLGLIPDERGQRQEAHNARTRDVMQQVDEQLEKIRSARSSAI